jgi:predicted amidohydrolase YtcJ
VLIRGARIWPADAHLAPTGALGRIPRTDVRLTAGLIAECAPGLRARPGEAETDARGGTLLPGLHDHHVHLRALAAAAHSVSAGPPRTMTVTALEERLREADRELPPGDWLRAVGYHESVAGDIDRDFLDRLVPHRPARVQHRTGAMWVVNSQAARRLGLDEVDLDGVERDEAGRLTGRLWRMDRWLADRVPPVTADLGAVSRKAASLGITGYTEATPGATRPSLAALAAEHIGQRLHCMAPPGIEPPSDAITLGPEKILLDDATLPSLDQLTARFRMGHAAGRPLAVHCVTRVQLILTLAAMDLAGRIRGDRIEHGAVIGEDSVTDLRGLTVVTQPHFVVERGAQYSAQVPPGDLADLWRLRSLIEAGVSVAAGTDAPFGQADPWHVMRAAVHRPHRFRGDEAISPARAVGLFLGRPDAPGRQRLVSPGQPADLTLLEAGPLEMLDCLASDLVATTFVGGEVVYARG